MSERTQVLKSRIVYKSTISKKFKSTETYDKDIPPEPEAKAQVRLCLERARLMTESYKASEGEPEIIRRAKSLAHILENMTIYINEDELIVGNIASDSRSYSFFPEQSYQWLTKALENGLRSILDDKGREEYKKIVKYWEHKSVTERVEAIVPARVADYIHWNGLGWSHHFELCKPADMLNIDKLFKFGLNGIAAQVEERLKELESETLPVEEYIEQKNTLEAMLITLRAACNFGRRYAAKAGELASIETDSKRKEELNKLVEICNWVPANPPRTLWEAIESCWLVMQISKGIEAPGQGAGIRLDVLMNPYYRKDKEEGRITREEAQELVECLLIKFAERGYLRAPGAASTGAGMSELQDLNIGGVLADGSDATNEFSFITLDAAEAIHTAEPTIALRYHPGISHELIDRAIDVLRTGVGYPAFFNDSAVIPYLLTWGASLEEARNWAVWNCVSISLVGKVSNPWTSPNLGVISLGKCLELALYQGKDKDKYTGKQLGAETPYPGTFTCIEDVIDAFLAQAAFVAEKMVTIDNILNYMHSRYLPRPFSSTLLDDCVEKGKDCTRWAYHSRPFVLMAGSTNAANSLAAIQKFVFDEKAITMEELIEACRTNFEGKEELRQRLLNQVPKFGNDDDYVDRFAREVHARANAEFAKFKSIFGYPFNFYGSIASGYLYLSRGCGATPDGRKDSESFADAVVSPSAGTDKKGPTAVLNSVAKIPPSLYPTLLNQKFLPQYLQGEYKKTFAQYLRTWADLGIFHIQFNVVTKEDLLAAQAHPEKYSDLVVRVAGYSAYFTDLATELQNEIIARAAQQFR
ncbi:glycyl radical protein [Chloroflexota bacterium]